MRMFRTILTAILTAVLSLGAVAVVSSPAEAAKPKRVITEEDPRDYPAGWNSFKLKGVLTQPQVDGTVVPAAGVKVELLKRTCRKCKWKKVRTTKTTTAGKYKMKIYAPRQGAWWWRTRVKGDATYAKVMGKKWAAVFR